MSQEDFAPRKKGIDDFTQDELEKFLHVDLAPNLSPGDLIEELKERNFCRIIVDRDFNIYLGISTHFSMKLSLGNPSLLVDDGYIERKKPTTYNFVHGGWGMYFRDHSYNQNLIRSVGTKVIGYLDSIGVDTK